MRSGVVPAVDPDSDDEDASQPGRSPRATFSDGYRVHRTPAPASAASVIVLPRSLDALPRPRALVHRRVTTGQALQDRAPGGIG